MAEQTKSSEFDSISEADSYRTRIGGWFNERFPVVMLVAGLPSFLAAHLIGQVSFQRAGTPEIKLGLPQVAGWLCAVGFLLCVRIFDEHKDYDDDVRLHPERLVSRGVVALSELRSINAVNVMVLIAYCLWVDAGVGPVTATFAVAFLWLLLMKNEFFIGEWLRPRLVLYALSHAVVTPLVGWWMVTSGSHAIGWNRVLVPYLVASYASSLLFEFARKILPPELERPEVPTYSSVLGPRRAGLAAGAMAVVHAVAMGISLLLVRRGVDPLVMIIGLVLMGVVAALAALAFGHYATVPSEKNHKLLEPLAALAMLVPALVIIVSILVAADIHWTWT